MFYARKKLAALTFFGLGARAVKLRGRVRLNILKGDRP
jgi:hypothetical protein